LTPFPARITLVHKFEDDAARKREDSMSIEFRLPELGENVKSGDVVSVLVREGDVIAANDGVIELETDKAVVEISCPHAGKVVKVHVAKGQTLQVGQPVLTIEGAPAAKPQAAPETKPRPPVAPAEPPAAEAPEPGVVPAGPEARRLARELGVDLSRVAGSGKGGRITVEDIRAAAAAAKAPAAGASPPEQPAADGIPAQRGTREPAVPPGELGADAYGHVRRERMSKIRRTIAAQMVKSAGTIPHVTNFDDADVTELERMRKTIPPAYLGPTVKLTALPFAMKAAALALRQHPLLNASLDEEKQEIIYKQYVNVGVAVDTPRGLVVPVLRNVDQMGVLQIARELTLLTARARSAEFGIDELRGGTFTISNLGAVGGTYSTPIINHPEVAVLLLGRSRWQLAVFEGKIESRLMMPLSLSYDHRVVDGAAAGRFLNDVIDFLQSPGKLLLTK
jgi:pyruvate dehydrogenase E2 component (dihydrolipoamide acetyltransferase)